MGHMRRDGCFHVSGGIADMVRKHVLHPEQLQSHLVNGSCGWLFPLS